MLHYLPSGTAPACPGDPTAYGQAGARRTRRAQRQPGIDGVCCVCVCGGSFVRAYVITLRRTSNKFWPSAAGIAQSQQTDGQMPQRYLVCSSKRPPPENTRAQTKWPGVGRHPDTDAVRTRACRLQSSCSTHRRCPPPPSSVSRRGLRNEGVERTRNSDERQVRRGRSASDDAAAGWW